ncbi:pantoate--beta-alanine ligase [Rhodohalobacter sulfatireducens]|uniref:Pantothenate synthetase n=1 Tax=Rhodohalobacter sulfatireducens TaxID=2911366 RepID=A0ABS9KCN5_9BACT|nr:pantoate--beta-alanine ligase [Rhodohalobacter sulfatireducens]MCG2588619.1 pantoate--beta-alanine ligase [Rhodohalobacter sulfatireducens]
MDVFSEIDSIRSFIKKKKTEAKTIGFVPTMGSLHEGHLSLIKIAAEKADEVIVSIYVNPEQFGPDEDFEQYPRELDSDLEKCEELGVSAVFTPSDENMYGYTQYLRIEIDKLNRYIDGGSRPGFFEGILLVVNKLFNIIEPDFAVFGQKDIQQFIILQQMVTEFNHGVELVMGPIIRANDGLALSSRNAYLSEEERQKAPSLYRSLQYIEKQIAGGVDKPKLLLAHQKSELEAKGLEIDYLNLFDKKTLKPAETLIKDEQYIIAGAVWLGVTRLIDNILIEL